MTERELDSYAELARLLIARARQRKLYAHDLDLLMSSGLYKQMFARARQPRAGWLARLRRLLGGRA